MPFRDRPADPGATPAASGDVRDAVDQMVRQFADPMAFYRELVQNSIDAGARSVEVLLDWEGAEGVLHASVVDDGAGMDRDVIEGSLLVLFRSTKDRDPTKIGKFGVGFFSVFAAGPREVRVDTGTDASREGLRLRLRPDFAYDLETSAPRRGTAVTLEIPMGRREAEDFAERSFEALRRWCPHVEVALHIEAHGIGTRDVRARVDRPFTAEGEVSVAQRAGAAAYALALAPRGGSAFYNRGILLHESDEAPVPGVLLKVNAPDLHHTLSRDNVRRDDAYARAVARARAIAAGPLAEELAAALRRRAAGCAEARARGEVAPAAVPLPWLYEAALAEPFELGPEALSWPLVAPVTADGEARVAWSFGRGGWFRAERVRYARDRTALALALAKRAVPVVDLGAAGPADVPRMLAALTAAFGDRAVDVHARHSLPRVAHAASLAPHEAALMERVGDLLAAVDHGPALLGEPEGVGADRLWVALRDRARADLHDPGLVVDAEEESPFELARGSVLVLNRAHPRVRAALAAAAADPRLAALVLARAALLYGSRLDEERDHALLARAALGG